MSLKLHDIERGVGADLLRRPIIANVLNASLLRSYLDFKEELEEEDDWDERSFLQQGWVTSTLATVMFLVTHLVGLLGLFETIIWVVIAIIFKLFRLPKIYAFEKLLLDVNVLIRGGQVKHIEKIIQMVYKDDSDFQKLEATQDGYGIFVLTTITCEETLNRDTQAMLRLLRYMNNWTIAYWRDDSVIMVGRNKCILGAMTNMSSPCTTVDLGWHKDIVEQTTFKLSVRFTRDRFPPRESDLKVITRRAVVAEIVADTTTENLELLVQCMGQYAAVCEAAERGRRLFNGKRISIYGVGILISVALILRYEGLEGLIKPSADVLTLAVGAYTLWMTLGKSAALGEVEEEAEFEAASRSNILMTYHGLARINSNVENTCWVPEIHHEISDEIVEGPKVDGSISKLEAAICLSIFEHFGHLLKWKGRKLVIDHIEVGGEGMGHVTSVKRIRHINWLQDGGSSVTINRIGAPNPESESESVFSA